MIIEIPRVVRQMNSSTFIFPIKLKCHAISAAKVYGAYPWLLRHRSEIVLPRSEVKTCGYNTLEGLYEKQPTLEVLYGCLNHHLIDVAKRFKNSSLLIGLIYSFHLYEEGHIINT